MHTRILLVTLSLAAAACGRGSFQPPPQPPKNPLLANLKAPPLNRPVKMAPLQADANPTLPPGNRPALIVYSQGRALEGTHTWSGRLAITAGRIECTPQDPPPIIMLYRLPKGLPELPPTADTGQMTIVERSNAGGPDHQVLISRNDSLVLAEIGVKAGKAVTVDLGNGLRLRQEQVAEPTLEQRLISSTVQLFDGSNPVATIPVATPTKIETRAGVFFVFIETSHVASTSDLSRQHTGGYILEAWVVRSQ